VGEKVAVVACVPSGVTGVLATTHQYGPPKPPEPRKVAEAAGLLLVLLVVALVMLFVGWIALGVIRRRWIGLPGWGEKRRGRGRATKDPWFEAGQRAQTAGPRDAPPPGEEPFQ
jgi:hypothetical protein